MSAVVSEHEQSPEQLICDHFNLEREVSEGWIQNTASDEGLPFTDGGVGGYADARESKG